MESVPRALIGSLVVQELVALVVAPREIVSAEGLRRYADNDGLLRNDRDRFCADERRDGGVCIGIRALIEPSMLLALSYKRGLQEEVLGVNPNR